MPELRLNVITREWVIIATERAKRPEDFKNSHIIEKSPPPPYLATCPFCPGNERKTSKERFRSGDTNGWKIRVVENKYPALSSTEERKWTPDGGIRKTVSGAGIHEVIIENPLHNMNLGLMEPKDVEEIVGVYKTRFIEAHRDPRVEHVIVFKNYGEAAGTTLEHPHSQLIATPVVPVQFRDRVQSAMHYFDDTGDCLFCTVLKKDREDGSRVVIDTRHFMTFIPYAALSPFHTWIFPKRHSASFASITEDEVRDLAHHLRTVLAKFYHGLEDPDYNYVIRSSRPEDEGNNYCHWYLSIVPRITKAAGFELGSGMFINTSLPEKNAEFLRTFKLD